MSAICLALYSPFGIPELDGRLTVALRIFPSMGRYQFPVYTRAPTARYIVLWDWRWKVIGSGRLDPTVDLSGAMTAVIDRLEANGWQAEATPEYGFVFIRRENQRCLLMLTSGDPYDTPLRRSIRSKE